MDVRAVIVTLVTAVLGSLGFSILFYMRPRRLPLAALAGFLTCAVYLAVKIPGGGELVSNLLAALAGAVFAEITARLTKAPVPVYLLPGLIPLVPGGALYETMSHLVSGDYAGAGAFGLKTLQIAVGIAGGIITASVLGLFLRYLLGSRRASTPKP